MSHTMIPCTKLLSNTLRCSESREKQTTGSAMSRGGYSRRFLTAGRLSPGDLDPQSQAHHREVEDPDQGCVG
jgi:hypothetical protein